MSWNLFRRSSDPSRSVGGLSDYSSDDATTASLNSYDATSNFFDWGSVTGDGTALGDLMGEVYAPSISLAGSDTLASAAAANGPLTVAQAIAAYNANPNLPPLAISDTAANVGAGLDLLQAITAHGALTSISLTDAPNPMLVNPTQVTVDTATLALIAGPYSLAVAANGLSFPYIVAGNVDSLTVSGETGAQIIGNAGFNSITLGNGNSIVDAGSGGSYIVVNGGGNEVLGGAGGNTIYAFGGDNYLQGGPASPSDVLVAAGSGFNEIYGGGGNNYIVGGTGTNILVGGGGINSIYSSGSRGDYIVGGTGNSNVISESGVGDSEFWGGPGNNYIVGGGGNDLVSGGASNDYLFGGAGNDTIYGGGGTDAIYPGAGNDFIWTDNIGQVNTDYIYETPGTGVDTIADFTPGSAAGHDVLVLSGAGNLLNSFTAVQGRALQVGMYTELPITSADQIYLYNVLPSQLTANDFIFT